MRNTDQTRQAIAWLRQHKPDSAVLKFFPIEDSHASDEGRAVSSRQSAPRRLGAALGRP